MSPSSSPHRDQHGGSRSHIHPQQLLAPIEIPVRPLCETKEKLKSEKQRLPSVKRTHARTWCSAGLCLAFSVLLIAAGVATLVVFLVIKPRQPHFDAPEATVNSIYIDSPGNLNADFLFLANFSNPNQKIELRFEHVSLELYFRDTLIATLALQPFSQRRGEVRTESVHMVSSEVFLTPVLVMEMQQQMGNNHVIFSIRGAFRVKGSLGLVHFSYWLYARCTMTLARPPNGVLQSKTCKTGR